MAQSQPIMTPEQEQKFRFRRRRDLEAERWSGRNRTETVEPVERSYGAELVSNIPGSAAQFAEDITYPIRHPIKTAESLGNLAIGGVQKLIPGEQEKEVYADQLVEFIKDRYGSLEAAKQTLKEDPVGAIGDVAAALTGAGMASRVALPAKISKGIQSVGAAIEPTSAIVNAAKLTGKIVPKSVKAATTDAIGNLLPRHRKRAGNALNEIAGPDRDAVISALENAQEIVPGNAPSAGQAASVVRNTEMAALDSIMDSRLPTPRLKFTDKQRAGRLEAIEESIARTPEELNIAKKTRKDKTDPLYKRARESTVPVNISNVVDNIDELIKTNPGNDKLLTELNKIRKGLVGEDGIHRTNAGEVISSVEGLKTIIGDKTNMYIKKTLSEIKESLRDSVPDYKRADKVFAELSKPINRMEIGQKLLKDLTSKYDVTEGVTTFVNALENARLTVKKSTGEARYNNLEDILLPEQLETINKVRKELNRDKTMKAHGRLGEESMQRKLGTALAPAEAPPMLSTKMMIVRKIMSRLKGSAGKKTMNYLAERQFSPKEWAKIMREASPEERLALGGNRNQALISGALLESGKYAQENQQ